MDGQKGERTTREKEIKGNVRRGGGRCDVKRRGNTGKVTLAKKM